MEARITLERVLLRVFAWGKDHARRPELQQASSLLPTRLLSQTQTSYNTSTSPVSLPDDLSSLINQVANVFEDPKGLPPSRSCDHQIPLPPDSKPGCIRPYRHGRDKKDSIGVLLDEMLQQAIIKPSHSSCASPVVLVKKHNSILINNYNFACSGISAHYTMNIQDYMLEKLGIEKSSIPKMSSELYKNYGTTMIFFDDSMRNIETGKRISLHTLLDITLGVSLGLATQVSMFVVPLSVIVAWIMGIGMDLYFKLFETGIIDCRNTRHILCSADRVKWSHPRYMLIGQALFILCPRFILVHLILLFNESFVLNWSLEGC